MAKLVLISIFVFALCFAVLMLSSAQRRNAAAARLSSALRHPFVRSVLMQAAWRLIRLILFRR